MGAWQVPSGVPDAVLGRTNRAYPAIWISLAAPQAATSEGWRDRLVTSALEAQTVIDISKGPALWGGALRQLDLGEAAQIMTIGGLDAERATDARHARDLVEAHLIETLSAIGRDHLEFYFFQVRGSLKSYQTEGALEALEMARQEGHVRHVGLCCDGPASEIGAIWQAHDAFDAVLTPRNHYSASSYGALIPLAKERRVGMVTSKPLNWGYGMPFVNLPIQWKVSDLDRTLNPSALGQAAIQDLARDNPVLVGVRTAEEIGWAMAAPETTKPDGFEEILATYRTAWDSEEEWKLLSRSQDPIARKAAERRRLDRV